VSHTRRSHLCFLRTTQLVTPFNTEKREEENVISQHITQVAADTKLH